MKNVRRGNTQGVVLSCLVTAVIVFLLALLASFTAPPVSHATPFDSDGYNYFALQEATAAKDAERSEQIKEEARESVSTTPAETTDKPEAAEKAGDLVSTDDFEFALPAYWKDRVTVAYEDDGSVNVYANDLPENRLITVKVVDASQQLVGGDIGNSNVFHKDNDKGQRVELWMTNYAWIVFTLNQPGAATPSDWSAALLDPAIAKEVVALQTLGAVDAEQIIQAAQAGGDEFETQGDWFNAVNAITATFVVK